MKLTNRNSDIINKAQNFQPLKYIIDMIIRKLGKIERNIFTITIYIILLTLSFIVFFFSAWYVSNTVLLPILDNSKINVSTSEIITTITAQENKSLLIMSFGFISVITHAYLLTRLIRKKKINIDVNI